MIQERILDMKRVASIMMAGVSLVMLISLAGPVQARAEVPLWHVSASFAPSELKVGGEGEIFAIATNLGDAEMDGAASPVTVTDNLPAGLEATSIVGSAGVNGLRAFRSGVAVTCEPVTVRLSCIYPGPLPPYEFVEVTIHVKVLSAVSEENQVSVTGGEANGASAHQPVSMSGEPTRFGIEDYELVPMEEDGSIDTQAGSHPFQLMTTLALNKTEREQHVAAPALTQSMQFYLPPGLVGNVNAVTQCTDAQFNEGHGAPVNGCPPSSAIGVATPTAFIPGDPFNTNGMPFTRSVPLFNLTPSVGEPARFGFDIEGVLVTLDTSVRTGSDYGVTVSANDISQVGALMRVQTDFWGVPGDPKHDQSRGWQCIDDGEFYAPQLGIGACNPQAEVHPPAFLSLPGSCGGFETTVHGESWPAPGKVTEQSSSAYVLAEALDGCNGLLFAPAITTMPDVADASTPTGLTVDVHVPQEAALNPEGTAESAVKRIEVTLPEGVTVNPGGAEGLQACSEEQVGFKGSNAAAVGGLEFTPTYPSCPKQSKIATVTIHTPLLPNPLEGFVYLATPSINGEAGDNPYNSLIAMYLVAEDPVSGTLVKLPMHVYLCEKVGETVAKSTCEAVGQLVTTVDNPELPFEDAELHFFGGSRAPLATPALCGTYPTKAVFTPWSGQEAVTSTATFNITSGPNGSPCFPSPLPFAPEFQAGTTNIQAGAFTPFTTTLGHPDGDQPLAAVAMKMPPGLSGSLAGVTLCPEPQAREATCGPQSLIGHTIVTAGLGNSPAVVARPGNVYITGPYNGHGSCKVGEPGCAPFGLSIANPAETGPFDLEKGTPCDCVVVRAKVEVDPLTAQLTVVTDPLPTVLKGIPLSLQHVNVTVGRPNFMFNPTNCAKMAIAGSISGGGGAVAPVSTPFQAANCATLPFKAGFSALTQAHHTRADGDSLHVVVTSGAGQANIAKIRVELPKVLPSRLTTLQKACTEAQFDSNPAGCPAGSIVGHATIHTPLVPVPLEGPAYFVSHGGAKFPELVMVLQGYGITVELKGETFISKAGVTSSTFNSIPDTPFTRSELVLPAASNSALAANGNLCADKLVMPTTLTAQNGAVIKKSTPIAVAGCKPVVTVVRHSVNGSTATVVASVPSGGKLIVTGKGLVGGTKTLAKAGDTTVDLSLSKRERQLLARHRGRRLKVRVHLLFEPTHGSHLSASVTLLVS
jgi:hypothetical protein